ncbi:MAG TPA: hypothetical protein VFD58_29890 [Blastocatellia bacterium]|nr:hypothetical protein [Blastocatellia bacterium]
MSRRVTVVAVSVIAACLLAMTLAAGGKKTVEPDLARLVAGKGWKIHNRSVRALNEPGWKAVRFDEKSGDGVAWLEDLKFTDGEIEFDVRGKNVPQQSFVGIAFHGVDEKTYDAVYLRPFNFKSEDPTRRSHAVQYISHPTFTWQKLRNENPGKYEQPVSPVPDPDAWVHVRVSVASPRVRVFVNNSREAALSVEQLSNHHDGWVGFWVGNGAGGDFANLKITPAK